MPPLLVLTYIYFLYSVQIIDNTECNKGENTVLAYYFILKNLENYLP